MLPRKGLRTTDYLEVGRVKDRAAGDVAAKRVGVGSGSRLHQPIFRRNEAGKIAIAIRRTRNRVRQCVHEQLLAELLEAEEGERLVPAVVKLGKPDRTAEGHSVVALTKLVLDSGERLRGIQGFVDQVVIAAAAERVRAALADHVHHRAAGGAELRREVAGQNGDFLNRLRRWLRLHAMVAPRRRELMGFIVAPSRQGTPNTPFEFRRLQRLRAWTVLEQSQPLFRHVE